MTPSPRILLLEDDLNDRHLLEETLLGAGLTFHLIHVRNGGEFQSALETEKFDLIISDFGIPSYSGIAALALSRRLQPDTPFIFVSGTMGEERAVDSLKLGATDYVIKDRPGRLGPAVERALREAAERRERERHFKKAKHLEEQLYQAQKMEAIGRLAGGIAHDFNNLLLIIHGNVELVLRNEPGLNSQSRQSLKQVTGAAERAANLVRQLLAFSRKQPVQFQPFNLNQAIGNLTRMLDRIIGEDISLQCAYADNLPSIHADLGMIEQVLTNLIVNARDAMPQGGSLFITTETAGITDDDLTGRPEARPGEFVCLTVRDTGTGIAPEHLPQIFEPFFTTKTEGKGTGLGLATAYGIIKQHQGWIEVASRPGEGTVFKIFLPANALPAGRPAAVSDAEHFIRGHENILLVEDDDNVRSFVRQVLENAGYHIEEAAHGVEALKIWKASRMQFDLLLTDVVMPGGISGRKLAEQMQVERPQLKVVFMSGYHADADVKDRSGNAFLHKPCSIETLTKTVRKSLDENSKTEPAVLPLQ